MFLFSILMKNPTVIFDPYAGADLRNIVERMVDCHNVAITRQTEWYPVAFFLRDENSEVLGGLLGDIWAGWLHGRTLAVAAPARGHGFGRELMQRAECYALERGCTNALAYPQQAAPPQMNEVLTKLAELEAKLDRILSILESDKPQSVLPAAYQRIGDVLSNPKSSPQEIGQTTAMLKNMKALPRHVQALMNNPKVPVHLAVQALRYHAEANPEQAETTLAPVLEALAKVPSS